MAVRAAHGDEAAFETLVKRHKHRFRVYIQRHVEHPDDTDDVMQQVFISLWRNLRHYDPKRSFKQWLGYIVFNKCRDAARRAAVRRKAAVTFPPITFSTATPEMSLLRDQALQRLELAIDKMPLPYREALALTILEDLSQSEAALRLGVTVKAVEVRLYRARLELAGTVRAADLVDLTAAEIYDPLPTE
jgi:RNA polymerase sigma-70 factor (ECF subfamily)